jgi:hypothetical protein
MFSLAPVSSLGPTHLSSNPHSVSLHVEFASTRNSETHALAFPWGSTVSTRHTLPVPYIIYCTTDRAAGGRGDKPGVGSVRAVSEMAPSLTFPIPQPATSPLFSNSNISFKISSFHSISINQAHPQHQRPFLCHTEAVQKAAEYSVHTLRAEKGAS